jgi:DNA-binding CsgD family transcriptional regulator
MGSDELRDLIMHPEDIPRREQEVQRFDILENGEILENEYRIRHANGTSLWFRTREVVFERTKDGKARRILGISHDITAQKNKEEALRRREAELKELRKRYDLLTRRERQVMGLVVKGLLNKQIASQTGTTERTVKFHRHQIMEKMQSESLADLVRMAEKLEEIGVRL